MPEPSDNPYAAPTQAATDQPSDTTRRHSSFVWQVQLAAVAMIVQGALELFFSAYFILLFFLMPSIVTTGGPGGASQAQAQQITSIMSYYMIIGGTLIMLIGITRITAGIYGLQYQGRVLGIVVNLVGLLSVISCYCLPSAVIVCIYTSIIYFNRDVVQAFEMRSEGKSISDIREHFAG